MHLVSHQASLFSERSERETPAPESVTTWKLMITCGCVLDLLWWTQIFRRDMSGPEMHESGDSDAVKARETDTNQLIFKIHYFYKIHYFAGRPARLPGDSGCRTHNVVCPPLPVLWPYDLQITVSPRQFEVGRPTGYLNASTHRDLFISGEVWTIRTHFWTLQVWNLEFDQLLSITVSENFKSDSRGGTKSHQSSS